MSTRVPADIEGDLRGHPLPRLLYLLLKRAFLGRLELRTDGGGVISVFFRGGLPAFTDAYTPELVLSQVLMERGLLDQDQLNRSLALLAQRKLLHGKILRTLGVIDEEQLVDALCLQLRRKIYRLFALPPETGFALYSGEHKHGRVDEAARVRADSLFVIYNGVRNSYTLPRLQDELAKLGERKSRLHPQFDRIKKRFSFSDDEEPLLVLLEHDACSIRHLLSVSNLSPTHTYMLLYTLWVCEVLLPEETAAAISASTPAARGPAVEEARVTVKPATSPQPPSRGTQQILSLGRSPQTVEGLPSTTLVAKSQGQTGAEIDLPPPRQSDTTIEAPDMSGESILLPPPTGEQVVLTPPHLSGDYPAIELPPPQQGAAREHRITPPPADSGEVVLTPPPPHDSPVNAPVILTPPPPSDAPVLITPTPDGPAILTPPPPRDVPALVTEPPARHPPAEPTPSSVAIPPLMTPVEEIGLPSRSPPASTGQPSRKLTRSMQSEGAVDEHRKLIMETWQAMQGQTLFQLLGVNHNATADEVKEAYFKRAKSFHPDRVAGLGLIDVAEKAAQIFQRLNEANMTLGDAKQRQAYLHELETGVSAEQQDAEVRQAMEAEFAFQKGMVFLRKKAYRQAREEFQAAYEMSSNEGEHEGYLAWAIFCDPSTDRESQLPRVREMLQNATRKAPKSANCHYFLGEVYLAMGDENRALTSFREALKVKSSHTDSERQIRLINMRRDKAEKEKKSLFGRFRKK